MSRNKDKKAIMNERRQKQIVKNWLSSFVVTSALVVATVVSSPEVPVANFLSLETVGTDVYYSALVIDENNSLSENSLFIVATSSLDNQRQTLELGQTEGFFYDLIPNMEYSISIVGSTGFGEYAINSKNIVTSDNYNGAILQTEFIQESEYSQEMLTCEVELMYSDYKNQIKEVYIKYAHEITEENYDNYGLEYIEELVTEKHSSFTIYLPRINGELSLILEATLQDDSKVILDEKIVRSPTIINAYVYVNSMTEDSVTMVIYPDINLENATYYSTISNGDTIIEEKTIEFIYYEGYHEGYLTFENLEIDTEYIVDFFVQYVDAESGLQETQLFYVIPIVVYNQMPVY